MSHERPTPSPRPGPGEAFGFTEREQLFYRITHARFREIFEDETTNVHRIELSLNSYGEFLFVTLSKPDERSRHPVTFYGLGYHEYRERWIHQEWYWYQTHPTMVGQTMDKDEARKLLDSREQEIAPHTRQERQSQRAQLYEIMADLTDEDGALTELEDLEDMIGGLDGEGE